MILPLRRSPRRDRALACRAARTLTVVGAGKRGLRRRVPSMRIPTLLGLAILHGLGSSPESEGAGDRPARLEVLPAKVRLHGPGAAQRLVVIAVEADGTR